MKFFETSAVLLATVASAVAAAHPQRPGAGRFSTRTTAATTTATGTTASVAVSTPTLGPLCLTNSSAAYLVNAYAGFLTTPSSTNTSAINALASGFTDTSDSINWLAGIPLGGYTFSSLAAFVAGQGGQLPIGFTVQDIMFSCTEVAFRWTAAVGQKKWPAKGINMFTASNLNNTAAGWQILSMYSEFNVGAWEIDIGRTCSPQGANQ